MKQGRSMLACLAVVAWLPSCMSITEPSFESCFDEHYLRVDAGLDTMEWIVVEHGISHLQAGVPERIRAVLAGDRFYPAGGDSLLDIPTTLEWMPIRGAALDEASAQRIHEVLQGLRVEQASLVLDANGAPTLWRRFVLEHASEWVSTWNFIPGDAGIEFASIDTASKPENHPDGPWAIEHNALVFRAPASAARAAQLREAWKKNVEQSHPGTRTDSSFDGTLLELSLAPDASGWMPMQIGAWQLRRQLESCGIQAEPTQNYVQLRASAGLP